MKKMIKISKDDQTYLKGPENFIIRAYFYCSNGLSIVNEFRNLILGIAAIYITLKLSNIYLLVIMGIVSLIIITVTGYYIVHRAGKVREWLSIRFSSHYAMRTFDYTEKNYELLTEIRDLLKKTHENKI